MGNVKRGSRSKRISNHQKWRMAPSMKSAQAIWTQ